MTSSSSKHHDSSSSSKKHSSSSKQKTKSDNWTDVTEPEERRRIQNRIAQRKFREKVKEHNEKSERDTRNQEHAGRSYHVPESNEIVDEEDVSGLPWGGISMRHVVARGHESESLRGSNRDDYPRDGSYQHAHHGDYTYDHSYGSRDNSSGSGDYYEEQTSYYYPNFDTSGGDGSHT